MMIRIHNASYKYTELIIKATEDENNFVAKDNYKLNVHHLEKCQNWMEVFLVIKDALIIDYHVQQYYDRAFLVPIFKIIKWWIRQHFKDN
jgi:hypothetical protein